MELLRFSLMAKRKGITIIETSIILATVGIGSYVMIMALSGYGGKVEAEQETVKDVLEKITVTDTSLDAAILGLQNDVSNIDWEQIRKEADQVAANTELKVIQTAVDTMMIREGLAEVKNTPVTNNMSEFPEGSPLYPKYLRDGISRIKFTCDKTGQVKIAE